MFQDVLFFFIGTKHWKHLKLSTGNSVLHQSSMWNEEVKLRCGVLGVCHTPAGCVFNLRQCYKFCMIECSTKYSVSPLCLCHPVSTHLYWCTMKSALCKEALPSQLVCKALKSPYDYYYWLQLLAADCCTSPTHSEFGPFKVTIVPLVWDTVRMHYNYQELITGYADRKQVQ